MRFFNNTTLAVTISYEIQNLATILMKVLYITNKESIDKQETLNWFKFYCEKNDDLYLYRNLDSAKNFLIKEILNSKKHIDFIVTDWQFTSKNAKYLLSWVRESDETYSDNNFLFRSLPILLIEDKKNQSATIADGFDAIIQDFPTNSLKLKWLI